MRIHAPANVFLRRAQLTLMLAALVPTILMLAVAVILLATRGSRSITLVAGILVLTFCLAAVTGYILGSIFVARGAHLAHLQNDFLSAVSHEVRTPLTSMKMFIDTLRDDRTTDPAERARCLDVLHQEMVRLDGLVSRLIELSKIESGRHVFERKPVRVRQVVDEALGAFAALHVGSQCKIDVEVEDGLLVIGDRAALVQALTNLLANAWKYTGTDKRIAVTARRQGARHIAITVADNGSGIPRDEQRAVFDKFERGKSAIAEGKPGSGLGLAVVRAIVRAHDGKIDLESQPDRGSRFRIVLKQASA